MLPKRKSMSDLKKGAVRPEMHEMSSLRSARRSNRNLLSARPDGRSLIARRDCGLYRPRDNRGQHMIAFHLAQSPIVSPGTDRHYVSGERGTVLISTPIHY